MSESENLLGKFSVCKAVVDLNHNLIIFLHLKIEFYSSTSFLACSGNKWNAAYLLRSAMTTKQLKNLIKKSHYLKMKRHFPTITWEEEIISKIRLFQNFLIISKFPTIICEECFRDADATASILENLTNKVIWEDLSYLIRWGNINVITGFH